MVIAADYYVDNPGAGSVWQFGKSYNVTWFDKSKNENTVDVCLVHGPADRLILFRTLCSKISPSTRFCSYTVPKDIPSGIDYAIIVGGVPANYGYSSYFTIISDGPLPENNGCPKMGGKNCPESLPCCSSSGFCGSSEAHCGVGCDPKHSFNGKCAVPDESLSSSKQTTPTNLSKSNQLSSSEQTTPTNLSKSNQSKCGEVYCGAKNPCCSEFNYCGSTSDYCGSSCQPDKSFNGICAVGGKSASPAKTSTLSSTRSTTKPTLSSTLSTTKPALSSTLSKTKPTSSNKTKTTQTISLCGKTLCSKAKPCCDKNNKCGKLSITTLSAK
ncbi:6347_t:CDS:2 [Diversispora eburnea]|uniref:6347_t:CDS:1 n=1 Tax=Diversispora eburnea TaxID=1213867 RepID=A0A9N9AUA2_9GLOM|nr:6347_t:CDS:2 [Diversispora eburnea]